MPQPWAVLWVFAIACGSERADVNPTTRFGAEHEIASLGRSVVHDVDIVVFEGEPWITWSVDTGHYVQRLTAEGVPAGDAERLGPACAGGVALASRGNLWVGCLVPGRPESGQSGHVVVRRRGADRTGWLAWLVAAVGPESRGMSLAAHAEGAAVAWLDRTAITVRTRLAEIGLERPVEQLTQELARSGLRGGVPDLTAGSAGWQVAFGESLSEPTGGSVASVRILDAHGAEHELAGLLVDDPMPALEQAPDPGALLFRDENPAGSRVASFLQRLDGGEPVGDPIRIGLADVDEPSHLARCGSDRWIVTPHRYGRREGVVGIHGFTATYERAETERQIYEAGTAYAEVAATCIQSDLLVVAATRQRGTPIRAVALTPSDR